MNILSLDTPVEALMVVQSDIKRQPTGPRKVFRLGKVSVVPMKYTATASPKLAIELYLPMKKIGATEIVKILKMPSISLICMMWYSKMMMKMVLMTRKTCTKRCG